MEYTAQQRALQDRFDTRRLADRINERLVAATIDSNTRSFIESRDMVFLASVDADGRPTCSYKGGDPGFIRVLDEHTLAMPSYDGNGMFLTLGNIGATASIGLLFIDFERPNRLRVQGTAAVSQDPDLLGLWPEAKLAVRIAVTDVFPNCPRYIHKYSSHERSTFVPRAGSPTPTPDWKRADWAVDVLPQEDPALS